MSVRCPPFTGVRKPGHHPDFARWLSTFELHARGASEHEKLAVLRLHLTENAHWFYESLSDHIKLDYKRLIEELKKCHITCCTV